MAGPMRRSMRSATPARSQCSRAMAVHSSDTSQHSSRPRGGRARATARAEYPVNVPTSTANDGRSAEVRMLMNTAWSWPICMPAQSPAASAVAAMSADWISSGGVLWASTYSVSSGEIAVVLVMVAA